jgi:hypothetical protein
VLLFPEVFGQQKSTIFVTLSSLLAAFIAQ